METASSSPILPGRVAWIRIVEEDEAGGLLERLYAEGRKRAGRVYQILKVGSLIPEAIDGYIKLYVALVKRPSAPLAPSEREMIATVVSYENDCFY